MIVAATNLRLDTTWIDYVLVVFYFVLVLGIGVMARRSVSSSLDFLLSGRSLPAWVTGLAFISANLGAIELIGMTANGAQYGLPTVHYYWIGAVPAMVFLGIVMMPFYYGSKARSVPEFLQKRFNHTTQRVNAVTFALSSVLIAGVNLFSLGLVLEALLGWSLVVAIPVAALVVLSYTFLGGLSAAIYNEVLQFFVILALLVPLTVGGLARVGGWDGLKEKIIAAGNGAELCRVAGHPAHRDREPVLVRLRHRVRARLRAVLRLLDHELRRGPARPVGQGHVGRPPHTDHRRLPEGAHPARHRDPRHDRRGAGARACRGEGGPAVGRHVQQRALAADERGAAQRRARRGAGGSPGRVHGGHGGQRQLAQHGVHLRHLAGLAASGQGPDHYYLQVGRAVTVIGCVLAIGTAAIAGSYSNLMDYIQSLFSFFNAPLFAIFILGLFWKRMTGTAGWTGLISGTIAAVIVDVLVAHGRALPVQPGGQLRRRERGVRRRRDRGDHRVDGDAAEARRRAGRADLVADVRRRTAATGPSGADEGWYRSPVVLGAGVIVLTIILYIVV